MAVTYTVVWTELMYESWCVPCQAVYQDKQSIKD